MKALALFVATLLFCARAQSAVLDGQVFIATKGGENFKLALVSVQVFPLDQMKAYVARKKAANKDREPKIKARYDFLNRATHLAAKQSTDTQKAAAAGDSASLDNTAQEARRLYHELQDEQRWWTDIYCYLHSSLYYFEDLPVPMAVGKTDADGKFSIDAPQPGPWVVAATANRHAGEDLEIYYWMVVVNQNKEGKTSVMLANDNQADTSSPDTLVETFGDNGDDNAFSGKEHLAEALNKLASEDPRTSAKLEANLDAIRLEQAKAVQGKLPQLVKESQARAISRHPDLAKPGSALNARFVARYSEMKAQNSVKLRLPDWPEELADACADAP